MTQFSKNQLSVSELLRCHNGKPSPPPKVVRFVKGGHNKSTKPRWCRPTSILDGAGDWELLVDFDAQQILFPPNILSTSERPDMILFSRSKQKVILAELTCPGEEGFEDASLRKKARYVDLLSCINSDKNNPWSAVLYTIEVGARGFVAHSVVKFLKKIGMSNRKVKVTCKRVSLISAKCSYAIFLMRKSLNWDYRKELLVLPRKESPSMPMPSPSPALPVTPVSVTPQTNQESKSPLTSLMNRYAAVFGSPYHPKKLLKDADSSKELVAKDPRSPVDQALFELRVLMDM